MKKFTNTTIPTHLRLFLLRCRSTAITVWRRGKKQLSRQAKTPQSAMGDGASYKYLLSDATEASGRPSRADKASGPTLSWYTLQSDVRITDNEDVYGVSVLTVDPALMRGATVPTERSYESTDDETMSNTSSKMDGPVPREPRGTYYANIQKKVEEKKAFNLAHFRRGSSSSDDSDDTSLFIQEASMAYSQFPNSFISIAEEESVASSASFQEESLVYAQFPNSFISVTGASAASSAAF